jgi:hypothetical protein
MSQWQFQTRTDLEVMRISKSETSKMMSPIFTY